MKAYFFQKTLRFLLLLVLLGTQLELSIAQVVILSTQADVDAFDPATTVINGNLLIGKLSGGSTNISHLSNLSNLTTITGNLSLLENDNLTNIDELGMLMSIGDVLVIADHDKLINIDGLRRLTSVGGYLHIAGNKELININGLRRLTSVGEFFSLSRNDNLIHIDGLNNLTSIGEYLTIFNNDKLLNIDGLSSLNSIGGNLRITSNEKLIDCCGINDLLENQTTSIGGGVTISGNPSECSSPEEVLASCRMELTFDTSPPCLEVENGTIHVFIDGYDSKPFYYEWLRQEDGLIGGGVSNSDDFILDMLGSGTYNITVTNNEPDTAIQLDIVLSQKEGYIFEILEVKTTNSSNGQDNGSISLTTAGGTGPYTYSWAGLSSGSQTGIATNFHTIPSLSYGEYTITVEDNAGASKVIKVSLLDELVQVIPCEKPLDIVILNDVSGSVNPTEYIESKQFLIDFLTEVNVGTSTEDSRAAIVEWSSSNEQKLKIPITGDMNILTTYLDAPRAFKSGTYPHEAMKFGKSYLDVNARINAEKVLILSTDGNGGQISSSLVALADEFKAKGFHIITIAFDDAYSNISTREILKRVASVDALAPGAPSYAQLDAELAKIIVFNYLCPIDPGSSATAYFNRDGAIDIITLDPIGNCPFLDFAEVTFDLSAYRELSIPAGTPLTFYHNNPSQAGATPILTWLIPCAIPVDSTETYTITLPMDGPSNIFGVLNDDGVQGPPISFPITEIEEIAYSNNIDNERICLDEEATIQAFKFSSLPIPSCDTIVNYTINVCNISEVDAFGIEVMDIAPSGFELTGRLFNGGGCAVDVGGAYDVPADCCFSLLLTYDAGAAAYGYYGDQGVDLDGPANQTYLDFDGSTTTDEDVTIDGSIDCPSTTIEFTKSVNIDDSCDDRFVEFAFTINNEMNIPLQGLIFTDVLPDPCTWAYIPYGESGLSIANADVVGNEAVFIIDEVQANTVATFYMDASLNSWPNDGTLNNTATLENVPDVINGGYTTLTSNSTNTQITASPNISLPDTIIVNAANDTVVLEALLSVIADVAWTTEGDGHFIDGTSENAIYIVGAQDSLDGQVLIFLSAITNCNETWASVLIQFVNCSLEVEIIEIGACDNMGTPVDGSDDTYNVIYTVTGDNVGQDSMFIISVDSSSDTLTYFTEHTLTLHVDGVEDMLSFVDLDYILCSSEIGVNQEICIEECSLFVENLTIFDCDDNGTPQDSTDDIYTVEFKVETNTNYNVIQENKIFGPFESNIQASISLSADNISDTLIFTSIGGDSCFIQEVVNQNNCFSEIAEKDSLEIVIPNIFSPNGDKINDEWFVTTIAENIKLLDCSIYDRWGNRVYNYSETNPIWNGQYNQKHVSEGVYIYVLTYVDGNLVKKKKAGDVTVIH